MRKIIIYFCIVFVMFSVAACKQNGTIDNVTIEVGDAKQVAGKLMIVAIKKNIIGTQERVPCQIIAYIPSSTRPSMARSILAKS